MPRGHFINSFDLMFRGKLYKNPSVSYKLKTLFPLSGLFKILRICEKEIILTWINPNISNKDSQELALINSACTFKHEKLVSIFYLFFKADLLSLSFSEYFRIALFSAIYNLICHNLASSNQTLALHLYMFCCTA